jgi:hypothetical protein
LNPVIWAADHTFIVWLVVILALGVLSAWKWSFVTAQPAVVAAVGVFVALIVNSGLTTVQLQLTRLSLESSLIYQMQKDTRTIGLSYAAGKATESELFAVMQSVFIQRQIGAISSSVWEIFQRDFCDVMRHENLRRDWAASDKSYLSAAFIIYMDDISKPRSSSCQGTRG